jgi:hypothetical protein
MICAPSPACCAGHDAVGVHAVRKRKRPRPGPLPSPVDLRAGCRPA